MRFNRTFMELKFNALIDKMQANGSFNRTFMELKCGRWLLVRRGEGVLIVPLWNWNLKIVL